MPGRATPRAKSRVGTPPRGPKITPMLEQYLAVKEEHRDALLFFRMGDFYEMFFEDAEEAARLLDITLTTRSRKDEVPIPMCGVPHHAAQSYVSRLLQLGRKIAICDQMENPATAKGIVRRAVVRVVTPGTVTEEEYLEPKQPSYLLALAAEADGVGVAYADLSTGEVRCGRVADHSELMELLQRLEPREILLPDSETTLDRVVRATLPETLVSPLSATSFAVETARDWLGAHAGVDGSTEPSPELGALIVYLRHTHRASLAHLRRPETDDERDTLLLDEATRRNLELLQTTRGERRGSLLWVLDDTQTPMGGRLLRRWLLSPLVDVATIGARLDAVEHFLSTPAEREAVRDALAKIGDLERLTARVAAARVNPRDLLGLAAMLEAVARLPETVHASPGELTRVLDDLDPLPATRERIQATLADDPPLSPRAGGVVRSGFDPLVDELRDLAHGGKRRISELEAGERRRTGIQSLKIRFNQVFGYYIEVTRANLHLVPEDYRRKQTLANAERFVTPELQEHEAKVLNAEQRLVALEVERFEQLVGEVAAEHAALSRTAAALARLDVFTTMAAVAERRRYVRPRLSRTRALRIREGRHPVVERMAGRAGFVPNDAVLDPEDRQILVLTGPNMAGKSTYLRQVALITLLAQIGCFVPAEDAEIGVVDRLFTRIGASDNLAGGESTFMVEMKETALILNQLTERSLVVLDEIGRGTSTFDGISIAWAVAEFLHDSPRRPQVLFATHYHELTDLARTRERVHNLSVAVREWKGEVVFLRRIVDGPANQSYGIQVARLAGVPQSIVERAREILDNLEKGELTEAGEPRLAREHAARQVEQLPLFAGADTALRDELATIDVERMTPLEALTRLHDLVQRVRGR